MKKVLLYLAALIFNGTCFSQNDNTILAETFSRDTSTIEALALYPQNLRNDILEVCSNPAALVRMEEIQKNSRAQFKNILGSYSKDEQQKIWDMVRYPGLIDSITRGGKKTREELNSILQNYPSEIRETALDYGISHYDALVKINALNQQTDLNFQILLKDFPEQTRASLNQIIKYPEIVTILAGNMHTTVVVGDVYKRNPELVRHKLDSMNLALAKQNAQELADWKSGLDKNPEAKQEYETSAKEYAKKQGYKDEDLTVEDPKVVVNYVVYPYPYWYGYPWWWDYPYWYPYPYWYDWGFYYGPHGIVYIGFPSWYFMHWYFAYQPHHYYYSHFSDYCVGHYYGHRGSVTSVHHGVRDWVGRNGSSMPRNFLANDANRPARLKEYGKFELDYQRSSPNTTRNEFLNRNSSSYPNLSPALREKPRPTETRPSFPQQRPSRNFPTQPHQYPPVRVPRSEPRTMPSPKNPRPTFQQPKLSPRPTPRRGPNGEINPDDESINQKSDFQEILDAQCFHQYYWTID